MGVMPNPHTSALRDPERRCIAKGKRNGKRCGNYAVVGLRVCRMHGGSGDHVLRVAAVRKAKMEIARAAKGIGVPLPPELLEELPDFPVPLYPESACDRWLLGGGAARHPAQAPEPPQSPSTPPMAPAPTPARPKPYSGPQSSGSAPLSTWGKRLVR